MFTLPNAKALRMHPLEDNLWCRLYSMRANIPWKENGNIVLPETVKEEIFFAQVVLAGPGRTIDIATEADGSVAAVRAPMRLEPGDNFLFKRFRGERLTIGTEVYICMNQDDVLMKIDIPETVLKHYFEWCGMGTAEAKAIGSAQVKE